jgi:hypothetical protein
MSSQRENLTRVSELRVCGVSQSHVATVVCFHLIGAMAVNVGDVR